MTAPADSEATTTDSEDLALLETAEFTSAGPPPIARPSKWAEFLKKVEDRGLDEDEEEDKATLGPFDTQDRAYSVASRISRGKFPGSAPAGKFLASARTITKEGEDGAEIKEPYVWTRLNPEYVKNPRAFSMNGDSAD